VGSLKKCVVWRPGEGAFPSFRLPRASLRAAPAVGREDFVRNYLDRISLIRLIWLSPLLVWLWTSFAAVFHLSWGFLSSRLFGLGLRYALFGIRTAACLLDLALGASLLPITVAPLDV